MTWPIDMILDLHRHLQRHRLWHKTPQRIATRLIAYGDLDHRLMFILGEGQGQGDGQLPLVYVKILIQSSEPMQRGRRERWRADDQSRRWRDGDRERDKTLGDRLPVDVQSSLNVDVERQPQALESPVRGRVEAGGDLDALGLGGYWGAVYVLGRPKPCSRSATPVSRSR